MKPMLEGSTPTSYWNENVLIPVYDFKQWLDFRINSIAWRWDFIISVENLEISIQTLIYAYSNYHVLSEKNRKGRINSMF
jgi:hypothetical protein